MWTVAELVAVAESYEVTLLIKSSGIYADTARLRTLLESYASDYTGALWDMHHPYRDFGESADATIKNLGTYVKHVHLRDSDENGDFLGVSGVVYNYIHSIYYIFFRPIYHSTLFFMWKCGSVEVAKRHINC